MIELSEHGPLIRRVLTELAPRRVHWTGSDERFGPRLSEYAAALDFELVVEPEAAELVISSAGDYATVRALLSRVGQPAVPVVVAGTAWPCGRRDAREEVRTLAAEQRQRYAFRLPVPGQLALSEIPSPIAFATIEGGPCNGVRTAVQDACDDVAPAWEVRMLTGFGGIAVLLPAVMASPDRWAVIVPPGGDDSLVARLELANAQLRLDRARLRRELDRASGDRADQAPAQDQQPRVAELERLAEAYEQQLTFVRLQATRIAQSRTWRWGHRIATVGARLRFRHPRGTDAVTRLLERVGSPSPPSRSPVGGSADPREHG